MIVCDPETIYIPKNINDIRVFLAGGISSCKEWQKEVIDYLAISKENLNNLVVFNPRRKVFNVNTISNEEQISWEFFYLENCQIFSMYFCNSSSVQPICLYELGRNILRMQEKYPEDWEYRIIISVESGYIREQDVILQMKLATNFSNFVHTNATPESHAKNIIKAYKYQND